MVDVCYPLFSPTVVWRYIDIPSGKMEASAVGVGHRLKVQVLSRSPSQRNFSNSTIVMMGACVLYNNALNFCLGTKLSI